MLSCSGGCSVHFAGEPILKSSPPLAEHPNIDIPVGPCLHGTLGLTHAERQVFLLGHWMNIGIMVDRSGYVETSLAEPRNDSEIWRRDDGDPSGENSGTIP